MENEPVSEFELEAYIDGQLDHARKMAVEDYLASNGQSAARVMADLRAMNALRLLAQESQPMPARLVDAAASLRTRLRRRRWRLPAFAGLAVAATIAGVMVLPTPTDRTPIYVAEALMAHQTSIMRAGMASQLESPAFDAEEIMRSTNIRIPKLPAGWSIADVQLFPSDEGPALQMVVNMPNGERLSLFAVRSATRVAANPVAVKRGGTAIAYWYREGTSYALTGTGSPEAIDLLADDLADNVFV
jgi:anti-sigma factor RsiW